MANAPKPNHDGTVVLEDGRSIGYAEFGDPHGDPLLWFHGTPGARQQLPPDTHRQAAERGLRIIGIDRPGTGNSTPYLYDVLIEFASDMEKFVDQLGLERVGAVGLSGGGPYVLACAHHFRDRMPVGVVLGGLGPTRGHEAAPGYTRLLPLAEPLLTVLREPLAELLNAGLKQLVPMASQGYDLYARFGPKSDRPLLKRPEMKSMFINDLVTAMEGGLRAPVYDVVLFARPWGFSLRNIQVPIHFFQGDADLVVPTTHGPHQAGLVPRSTLTIVPEEGHFAGFATVAHVLDKIRETWPRAKPAASAAPRRRPARKTARKR